MDYLSRFQSEYLGYHGISPKRVHEQLVVLRQLEERIGLELPKISPENLRSYLSDLIDQGYHPNTVRKRRSMVNSFIRWAFEVELIDGDRYMRLLAVKNPKGSTRKPTPRPYSVKELREFRKELDETWPYVSERWWRNYRLGRSRYWRVASDVMRRQIDAIVALALQCGLRQQEIFNLSIDDMHHDNAYIVVRQRALVENGKDRFREVPYTEGARAAVKCWLETRAELNPPHDHPWIKALANKRVGPDFEPMGSVWFGELLQAVGGRNKNPKRECWKFHRFRHTAATAWLRAGMDLELLSEHLGHQNISETLGYAELVRDDIQKAVETRESDFERLIGNR